MVAQSRPRPRTVRAGAAPGAWALPGNRSIVGGMNGDAASGAGSSARRHHKPKPLAPADFEPFIGGVDPARLSEAGHLAAQALVSHGRANSDPKVTRRLVKLADKEGLEVLAELWAPSPARSLPGALWRLYALRTATMQNPARMSAFFTAGQQAAQVSNVVAGVAEPPGADEVRTMADSILSGAFDGDFDVALERTAAFCRVVALGQANHADAADAGNDDLATRFTRNSHLLLKTAEDLEAAAMAWRRGDLT